jgi:hypothetical protein
MIDMTENLHLITSKLIGHEDATAFSINRSFAITARHAVELNIEEQSAVELEFYTDGGKGIIKRTATVVKDSEEYDIAILKLNEEIIHINNWIELSDQIINADDQWEVVGFPANWNEVKQGSKYCYIKGEVFQNSKFDSSTKYDIHLASKYIKEEWEYTFGGLSGAAMLSDGKIVGVVIDEEYSAINSPLKAISINKIKKFILDSEISIDLCINKQDLWRKENILSKRMLSQKDNCNKLFFKINYENKILSTNISINSYFLKYNNDGTQKLKNLAEYISEGLMQFACSLTEINKSLNDLKMMKIHQKMEQCITKIKNNGMLGRIMLWMLMEGVVGAPKTFLRLPYDSAKEYSINEVHIGFNDKGKLVLYLGDGKLRENLSDAVLDVIKSLGKEISIDDGEIDLKNDIYMTDEYIYNNLDSSCLKALLETFMNPSTRDWNNVEYEVTIFTGYNSFIYQSAERFSFSHEEKEQYVEQIFIKECEKNEKDIYSILESSSIKRLKINWFVLPFNTISGFEELVLNVIRGEEN